MRSGAGHERGRRAGTREGSAPPGVPAPAAGDSGAPSNRQSSRRKNYGTRGPGEQGRRGCFRKLPLGLHPSPRVPFPQRGWEGSAPRGEGAGAAGTQAIGPEPPRPARHQLLGIWRRRLRARLQLGSARPRPPPPRGRRPAAPAPRPLQVAAVGAPGWRLMEPPRCSRRGSWISRRRSTRGERGWGARAAGPASCAASALPPPPREFRVINGPCPRPEETGHETSLSL